MAVTSVSASPTYPATLPVYLGSPRAGSCQLANADGTTAKDFSNITPVAAGTKVTEIRVTSGPTTAPGGTYIVNILFHDGTNARILETASLTNSASQLQAIFTYENLVLPTGYKLQAIIRTALTAGATLDFLAFGADYQA
jgi:hypothetical protein